MFRFAILVTKEGIHAAAEQSASFFLVEPEPLAHLDDVVRIYISCIYLLWKCADPLQIKRA